MKVLRAVERIIDFENEKSYRCIRHTDARYVPNESHLVIFFS